MRGLVVFLCWHAMHEHTRAHTLSLYWRGVGLREFGGGAVMDVWEVESFDT